MLYTIRTQQLLKSDLQTIWDFISSPRNLATITPDYMGFVMTNDPGPKMFAGQIITYKVRPVAGLWLDWVTEITHVGDKEFFVDEQRFGPYAFWHHKHFLQETPDGILMCDEVHYKIPLGILGRLANKLFVRKKLEGIFNYRYRKLEELFNKNPALKAATI